MCPHPDVRLPENFKFPDMDKFDGTGNPVVHLRMFVGTLQPMGLEPKMFCNLFHHTLTGAAAQWFLSLEDSKTKNWEDIMDAFVAQYSYNTQLDVTLRDLETTRQNFGEAFVDFLSRWRGKVAKMTNRPTEMEQVQIVVKNLRGSVKKFLIAQPLTTFQQLYTAGIQVEDAIHLGILDREESSVHPPRKFGNDSHFSNLKEVNAIDNQVLQNPNPRGQRSFISLNMSLSEALDRLVAAKYLIPLQPSLPPAVLPKNHKPSQYCKYHQSHGHKTNNCALLRHSIQDLIDAKKIAPPNPKPNTTTNPLPNHDQAFPPPNVNFIDDLPPFDPSLFIIPPKPIAKLPSKPEVCLVRIPEPESDSNGNSVMSKLYHFNELYIHDVKSEWFDLNKAVNNDRQNEIKPSLNPK